MNTSQMIDLAIELARKDQIDRAYQLLYDASQREPENARIWFLLHQVAKDQIQALRYLERAQAIAPGNARIRERYAELQAGAPAPDPKRPANKLESLLTTAILALILLILLALGIGLAQIYGT